MNILQKFTKSIISHTKKMSFEGFTIVELMISLAVLSVILTMGTVIMIRIQGLYDQGVSSSNLQSTARTIVSDIASAVQFNGSVPVECVQTAGANDVTNACAGSYSYNYQFNNAHINEQAYCIGTIRYSYILDSELGKDYAANPVTHASANTTITDVLWRDTLQANKPCAPVYLPNPMNTTYSADTDAVPGSGYEMMGARTRLTGFSITQVAISGVYDYSITLSSAYGDSDLVNINTTNPSQSTCNSRFGSVGTEFCSTSSITTTAEERVY